jgi:hypothetical protein
MSQEDKMANALADPDERTDVEFEVHYNHYGDRGCVDMVVEFEGEFDGDHSICIYELKSDNAIKQATGANEIIRQFNRHRDYFFEGTDYNERDYYSVSFSVLFYASQFAMDHVAENEAMYRSVTNKGFEKKFTSGVGFYRPEMKNIAWPFSKHIALDMSNVTLAECGVTVPECLYPDGVAQNRNE